MTAREAEFDLLSPPRPSARLPGPISQSTPIRGRNESVPVRDPRPADDIPEQKGASLASLTDGDKATLVLKVRAEEAEAKGRNKATKYYALRRGENSGANPEFKTSFMSLRF